MHPAGASTGPLFDDQTLIYNPSTITAYQSQQSQIEYEFNRRRVAQSIHVPTRDEDVRTGLRQRKNPVCLFGEDAHDRRERLRELMLKETLRANPSILQQQGQEGQQLVPRAEAAAVDDEKKEIKLEDEEEDFFVEGTARLKEIRQEILKSSLHHAKLRVAREKILHQPKSIEQSNQGINESKEAAQSLLEGKQETLRSFRRVGRVYISSSHTGDSRPLSACALQKNLHASTANNTHMKDCDLFTATGSWTGMVKLWQMDQEYTCRGVLVGHMERISHVSFHPLHYDILASASADSCAKIWNFHSIRDGANKSSKETHIECTTTFQGHRDRVTSCVFHPHLANLMATSSYDTTWRLWDLEKNEESILVQEGHLKGVSKVAIHRDGSLLASVGVEGATFLWDLRSGQKLLTFRGHLDNVTCVGFSPDGYHLATGSADHTIKIWDLRRRKCAYTIAAHSSIVSDLTFQSGNEHMGFAPLLISSSFDKTCKVWSSKGWLLARTLSGHEEKVTSVDISNDASMIITTCYDKTWKVWTADVDEEADNGCSNHA